MELIKNKKFWIKYRNQSKEFYNLNDFNISDNEPKEYPCLTEKYLTSDINGVKLKFIFVYKKDFKLFKGI